jgi:hypothetical protein
VKRSAKKLVTALLELKITVATIRKSVNRLRRAGRGSRMALNMIKKKKLRKKASIPFDVELEGIMSNL